MRDCPKCGESKERIEGRLACPRCGLGVGRFITFDSTPPAHPTLDPAFAALAAGDRWQSRAAHDAFVSLAGDVDALDGAAARYRDVLRHDPDDAQARRALAQVVAFAAQRQQSAPRDSLVGMRVLYYTLLLVGAVLIGLGGAIVWTVVRARP